MPRCAFYRGLNMRITNRFLGEVRDTHEYAIMVRMRLLLRAHAWVP